MDQEKRSKALRALEKRGLSLGGVGQAAKTLGTGAWKALPLVGNLWSAGSAAYNLAKGNFGNAALDAAGAIPGVGNYVNLGRAAYSLGEGSGAAKAQSQPPQQLPNNYAKMAGLCPAVERTDRGLAFETGVERFCKEAGFDDEDRSAIYRMIVKLSGIGDDVTTSPDQSWITNWNDGTSVNPSGSAGGGGLFNGSSATDLNQDPRLSSWSRMTNLGQKAVNTALPGGLHWYDSIPGVTAGRAAFNLASSGIQGEAEKTMRADDSVRRRQGEEAMYAKNPQAYQQMMYDRATSGKSKSDQYLGRQRVDAFATAKHNESVFGMDPDTAIMEATKGLPGSVARAYQYKYRTDGQTAQPSSQESPGASPSMPGVTMGQPNVATLGRTAPPGASGGYMSGTPPAPPPPASGGDGMSIQKNPSFAGGGAPPAGAGPMGPPTPKQGPPAIKPAFMGDSTSSMGKTPGANPMTPPPKSSGTMAPPKTPKV